MLTIPWWTAQAISSSLSSCSIQECSNRTRIKIGWHRLHWAPIAFWTGDGVTGAQDTVVANRTVQAGHRSCGICVFPSRTWSWWRRSSGTIRTWDINTIHWTVKVKHQNLFVKVFHPVMENEWMSSIVKYKHPLNSVNIKSIFQYKNAKVPTSNTTFPCTIVISLQLIKIFMGVSFWCFHCTTIP